MIEGASFIDEFGNQLQTIERATEGEPRPGPWLVNGGVLPAEWGYWNHWQMDLDPIGVGQSPIVEACVDAYAQTIALCPGDHWRTREDGGRDRVTTSALSRVLRRPNEYQSRSDFFLNLVRQLYIEGNCYAQAERNDRFEPAALHLFDPRQSQHRIASDGTIFYSLAGNYVQEPRLRASLDPLRRMGLFPARDVLHVKLDAQAYDPLEGISPLRNCAPAVAVQNALSRQLLAFFGNMSRPSGVLQTDMALTTEQVGELRERWNAHARGMNAGGVPILTNGLKFAALSASAAEAEVTATLKITTEQICMAYGVPPAILGLIDKGAFSSTEALMQFWLARGLGFAINHIETALDQFFGLKGWPDEYVEFDVSALLRPAFKDRVDALVKGVQGGVFAPNEARRQEGYPDAEDGDEPRVQQQVVPLSAWSKMPPKTPAPEAPAAPPPAEPAPDDTEEIDAAAFAADFRREFRTALEAGHA